MRKIIAYLCAAVLILTACFVPVQLTAEAASTPNVSDSYTFDFNAGDMPLLSAGTPSVDSEGNTFYPIRAQKETTVVQEDITVVDAKGNASVVSTVSFSSSGHGMFIPVDKNGIPFELEPNSTYSVKVVTYAKRVGTWGQLFFGGGVLDANKSTYTNGGTVTFSDSTGNGNPQNYAANYPIFRTGSHNYSETAGLYTSSANGTIKVRYFTDYDLRNNVGQYGTGTLTFKTGDYNEENGCFELVGSDGNAYTFGAYFAVYLSGSTVNCYNGGTLVNSGPVSFNIDNITITKIAQNVNITLDANGGKFNEGTTLRCTPNIGNGIAPSELPVREGYVFKGWSFTSDGEVIATIAREDWNEKTLYAVWELDLYKGYDRFERYIDYSSYTASKSNSWSYTDDSPLYQSVVKDDGASGGAYLHFHCDAGTAGSWLGSYTLTLTASGSYNSSGSGENNVKFPENTTYRAIVRMRTNNLSGRQGTFFVSYGVSFNSALNAAANNYSVLLSGVEESGGFETYELIFTTPKEYAEGKVNCFLGFTAGGSVELDYDIDDITLQKVTSLDLYTVENGETELRESEYYQPGDFITLPDSITKEVYSDSDNTATTYSSVVNNWYSDNELSVPSEREVRAADTDTVYYANAKTVASDIDNQIGFCGFDLYKEDIESTGIVLDSNLQVSDTEAYTGEKSLKATGNGVFEIRNDNFFAVTDKTTYNISFAYKADKASTIAFGLGEIYNIDNNAANTEYTLENTHEWKNAQVTVTADFADIKNLETDPCLVGKIITDGNVYIDTVTVSSVVGGIGALRLKDSIAAEDGSQALRFMFAYKAGESANEIYIDGKKHTVAKRGILLKSERLSAALTVENIGNGVINTGKSAEMDACWSYNTITGNVVFSTYVNELDIADSRRISARGYIELNDGRVFYSDIITAAVTDIEEGSGIIESGADIVSQDGYESMNDYYVYLPEGTEIKGEEFKVVLYDPFFTVDGNANPAFVSEYVMEKASYVKLTAKGSISDLQIYVPADVAVMVEKGSKDYLSFDEETLKMSENIKLMSDGAVNYIFITDLHHSISSSNRNYMIRQMNTVVKIANENDKIDFIVVGGDITDGAYKTNKQTAITNTQDILNPFKESEKPVFVLSGNHDDNSYHVADYNEYKLELIMSDYDWSKNIIDIYCPDDIVKDSQYEDSKYYYYDMPEKKTRLVFFDTIDSRAKYDENGVVTELVPLNLESSTVSSRYKTGYSYWGYDIDQVEWLANEAMTAPDDWNYVYLSHMGIDGATNSYGNTMYNSEYIREILKAYQYNTIYESDELGTLDYSGTTGKITVMSFGHQHTELVLYSEDIDLWQISTACANIGAYQNKGEINKPSEEIAQSTTMNSKSYAWTWYYRKLGSPSQCCFDIISASKNKVQKYAFGTGSDRVLYYK